MLFSFAVRAVYIESCSMFVRGGVYRVVKEALGGTLAKISVSMLIFDYILTGQYRASARDNTSAACSTACWPSPTNMVGSLAPCMRFSRHSASERSLDFRIFASP